MTTNIVVIGDALREINVISEVETPSAEQGAHGLRKLNEMVESWTESDVELGYFAQSSTTDDCPIPAWAEKAVKAKLAIELAPTYGASISAELLIKADEGWSTILRKCINEKLTGADMTHLPYGTGHFGSGFDITNG